LVYTITMSKTKVCKDSMFSLRIPSNLLDEYREFCTENSINISQRLRRYMEQDLEMWRRVRLEKIRRLKELEEKKRSN
jgi:hypothetical protein